jgi:hypothetical protein
MEALDACKELVSEIEMALDTAAKLSDKLKSDNPMDVAFLKEALAVAKQRVAYHAKQPKAEPKAKAKAEAEAAEAKPEKNETAPAT